MIRAEPAFCVDVAMGYPPAGWGGCQDGSLLEKISQNRSLCWKPFVLLCKFFTELRD
jgi:microcystin-dependent protein